MRHLTRLAIVPAIYLATLPFRVSAETYTLKQYAYVESHGVNRVDTGYCAKPLSRYVIDFQMTQTTIDAQGIFGGASETPKCSFYTTNGSGQRKYKWYYRDSGSVASTFGKIDTQRRIMTVAHETDSKETAVLSLYDRTGAQTITQTNPHKGTATTPLSLFALGKGNYLAGTKRIYSFEAADTSQATVPTAFLAPGTNDQNAAGFYNVIDGTFHGEAESNPSTALTFVDGIGCADDYAYADGVFSARFHAYASDTEKGSVAFGNAAASGTAHAWVVRGSSVTLTATPQEGCDFVSWSGDTWAITSGNVESLSITVTSDTAVQFLATFKRKTVYSWTGSANESEPQWFTPANWIDGDGNVPAQIDARSHFVFPQREDITVNYNPSDEAFRIRTLTFADGAGHVTVTGAPMARVLSVLCQNGKANEMQNAVTFENMIDVTASNGHVNFSGGATGLHITHHTSYYGKYTISTTGTWAPPQGSIVKPGSQLNQPEGTYYCHNPNLTIEAGGEVVVKNTRTDGKGSKYLMNKNSGVFRATNEFYSDTDLNNGGGGGYLENTSGGGLFISPRFRATGILILPYHPTRVIVGPQGFIHGNNGYIRAANSGSHEIGSSSDWQIYHNDHDKTHTMTKGLRKIAGSGKTTVTFDTTDYADSAVGRTITAESGIGGQNATVAETLSIVVKGIGRFVFANTGINENDFAGGLTVKDSATVEVRPGARPGRGCVTLEDSARLVVSAGCRFTLGGTLALGAKTSLVVSDLTMGAAAPVTATGATAVEGAKIVVGGVSPLKPGNYPLLAVGSAADAAAAASTLTLDATAVCGNADAALVAKGATVCVRVSHGFSIIVR
jgi:hypothetical protein